MPSRFLNCQPLYAYTSGLNSRKDERPEVGYQVGVTLDNTEKPKCASDEPCLRIIEKLDPSERPLDITGHSADPKCRFFYKMTQTPPYQTAFPQLNMPNVIPDGFKDVWKPTMDKWGNCMKNAVEGVAEMAAIGFGLDRGTFKEAGAYGPHLLAPTASDLRKYGERDSILAGMKENAKSGKQLLIIPTGFHSDLNFLTIHGRSRYPGLNIWARNTGKRIAVKVPPGRYLLVQAGKQLEHLSGGYVKAGFHEVVVNEATLEVLERVKAQNTRPPIRISSTFFWHLSSDFDLEPILQLAKRAEELRNKTGEDTDEIPVYENMKVGTQVQNELKHIALMA
ncbi:hypothetical protein FRC03_008550 [Tulasnella sp. 419]|nr:hypothetical protein FRC03_008550 [Tulasnella sp. 419]